MKEILTLANVQVDCSNETEERIKEMADVCLEREYKYFKDDKDFALSIDYTNTYFQITDDRKIIVDGECENKTTITYEKFMELFGKEEVKLNLESNPLNGNLFCKEFNNLVEVLNEELTEEAYKETSNKLNYELDFNFITQLAERMAQNKHKYEPYNWQKLDNIAELKQALYRHVMEVMKGNYADDNRLFGHLESLALNAMFINYQLKKL